MADINNRFDVNSFLNKIMQNESSGGTNFNHRQIASGHQEGQTAIGRYGLLPNTVREINQSNINQGKLDPEMIEVSQLPDSSLKQHLEANPDIEQKFAQSMAQHLQQKYPGDEERMAYAWNNGHRIEAPITDKQLDDSNYVNKFRRVNEMMQNRQLLENNQQKPLESRMGDVKMVENDE